MDGLTSLLARGSTKVFPTGGAAYSSDDDWTRIESEFIVHSMAVKDHDRFCMNATIQATGSLANTD